MTNSKEVDNYLKKSNISKLINKIINSGFWGLLATVIIALYIVGFSLSAIANSARPGDILFPLDRGFEKLRISTTLSKSSKFKYKVIYTQERIEELLSFSPDDTDSILKSLDELDNALTQVDGCIDLLKDLEGGKEVAHKVISNLKDLVSKYRDFLLREVEDTDEIQQELDESVEQIQTLINQAANSLNNKPSQTAFNNTSPLSVPKYETVPGEGGDLIEVEYKNVILSKNSDGEYVFTSGSTQYVIVTEDNLDYAIGQEVQLHGWLGTNNSVFLTEFEVDD